jgi:hypothetical protein
VKEKNGLKSFVMAAFYPFGPELTAEGLQPLPSVSAAVMRVIRLPLAQMFVFNQPQRHSASTTATTLTQLPPARSTFTGKA